MQLFGVARLNLTLNTYAEGLPQGGSDDLAYLRWEIVGNFFGRKVGFEPEMRHFPSLKGD